MQITRIVELTESQWELIETALEDEITMNQSSLKQVTDADEYESIQIVINELMETYETLIAQTQRSGSHGYTPT